MSDQGTEAKSQSGMAPWLLETGHAKQRVGPGTRARQGDCPGHNNYPCTYCPRLSATIAQPDPRRQTTALRHTHSRFTCRRTTEAHCDTAQQSPCKMNGGADGAASRKTPRQHRSVQRQQTHAADMPMITQASCSTKTHPKSPDAPTLCTRHPRGASLPVRAQPPAGPRPPTAAALLLGFQPLKNLASPPATCPPAPRARPPRAAARPPCRPPPSLQPS